MERGAVILMLHRVTAIDPLRLRANEGLKVSVSYLELLVERLREVGYRFVSLDELARLVSEGSPVRRLAALTFDDGYRDNLEYALPLLERLQVPFTVYVTCAAAEGSAFAWWLALEEFLRGRREVQLADGSCLPCRTRAERDDTFMAIRARVLQSRDQDSWSFLTDLLPGFASATSEGLSKRLAMDYAEIRRMSESPFAHVGAHTMTHPNLRTLSEPQARRELQESRSCLQQAIGREVRHLAFPYGGIGEAGEREYRLARESGFITSATALPGSIRSGEVEKLHRLPRIFVREGVDPEALIAENCAREWMAGLRRLVRA